MEYLSMYLNDPQIKMSQDGRVEIPSKALFHKHMENATISRQSLMKEWNLLEMICN